jgi:hypothetical protein
MPDGSSVEGRDLSYLLPPVAVRVLSLVPDDASDIRDATGETFSDLDAQTFRANMLRVIAGVLFILGAVMAILALVRLSRTFFRREQAASQPLPDDVVLRRTGRELVAVQQRRRTEGWSDELAGRALAAIRIIGAYAVGGGSSQVVTATATELDEGHLVLHGGVLRGTQVFVSGSITAATVAGALAAAEPGSRRHADLEHLHEALVRFAALRYGRDGANANEAELDESLDHCIAIARRIAVQHLWPVRRFRALTGSATELGRRAWSR